MLCRKPYMLGTLECGCGRCLPCRINRRRIWAHRILLESFKHGDSCFVTLTYNDEYVPSSLVIPHYQKWLKRLRKAISPKKIRYFIAGEYGELTGRPHYHAALFGLDSFTAGGVDGQSGIVQKAWTLDDKSLGYTRVGELNWDTAQYVAGYLTKKCVNNIEYRHPEFSRMSLRPGIGASATDDIARSLSEGTAGLDFVAHNEDVPLALRHGGRVLPIGRYLARCLRGKLGFASKDTPPAATRLLVLRKAAEKAEARSALREQGFNAWDAEQLLRDIRTQKIVNLESRFQVRDQYRSLR